MERLAIQGCKFLTPDEIKRYQKHLDYLTAYEDSRLSLEGDSIFYKDKALGAERR